MLSERRKSSAQTGANALLFAKNTVHSTTYAALNTGCTVPITDLNSQMASENCSIPIKGNRFSSNPATDRYTPLLSIDKPL